MSYILVLAMALIPAIASAQIHQEYRPDDLPLSSGGLDYVPGLFNLSASLTQSQNTEAETVPTDSFWTSSYLTGNQGDKYFVITHIIRDPTGYITRTSLLDLTTHGYSQIQKYGNYSSNSTFFNPVTGLVDIHELGLDMTAISDEDPLAGLHVETSAPGVQINLTFGTASPALINGGAGSFIFSGLLSYEWAAPAARTWGSLNVNGTEIELDPSRSITWFDRQWNDARATTITTNSYTGDASWHWFQLHISTSGETLDIPLSAWVLTYGNGLKNQFATIREDPSVQKVVSIASLDTTGRTWTSPYTNITYEQEFKLAFQDGSVFNMSIVTGDQEFHSDNGASAAYEGYLEFTGVYGGKNVTGFGVVEIVKSFVG